MRLVAAGGGFASSRKLQLDCAVLEHGADFQPTAQRNDVAAESRKAWIWLVLDVRDRALRRRHPFGELDLSKTRPLTKLGKRCRPALPHALPARPYQRGSRGLRSRATLPFGLSHAQPMLYVIAASRKSVTLGDTV